MERGKRLITISNLTKVFNGIRVLDNLNLEVFQGEVLVIIGESGCGKTVLLKHLIGLLKPESGQIVIKGEDIVTASRVRLEAIRAKFGMLFQSVALMDSLTVEENVGFPLYARFNLPQAEVQKRVKEKLSLVGLSGYENLTPSELSGGMRKRVGLARAIITEPEIILYDEPTTGLDPPRAVKIIDLIEKLQSSLGVTSIIVTHDIQNAYRVANRIAALAQGKIIGIGSPREIRELPHPIIKDFFKELKV
jgi:phospholipid/cholesterol/gamma-HCH transport system ATP-binding protein